MSAMRDVDVGIDSSCYRARPWLWLHHLKHKIFRTNRKRLATWWRTLLPRPRGTRWESVRTSSLDGAQSRDKASTSMGPTANTHMKAPRTSVPRHSSAVALSVSNEQSLTSHTTHDRSFRTRVFPSNPLHWYWQSRLATNKRKYTSKTPKNEHWDKWSVSFFGVFYVYFLLFVASLDCQYQMTAKQIDPN